MNVKFIFNKFANRRNCTPLAAPILSIWHTSNIKYTTKNCECQIYFAKFYQKSELFGIIVHNVIKYTTNLRQCQIYFRSCQQKICISKLKDTSIEGGVDED